ncbi:AAA family ATPase [Archangium sp.]|uniref:AAA family ATPase n=1 Tax=Archangium sp. TaxID=1872627 RepID=UPI00286A94B9|nr:AAA family ATPase [Archangium sp.]
MYLTRLRLKHIKLLAESDLSFVDSAGQPRMWTVLLGDNGLCKSTILQCIAISAAGPKLGSALTRDASTLHRVDAREEATVEATFVPSSERGWKTAHDRPDSLRLAWQVSSERSDVVADRGSRDTAELLDDVRASKKGVEGWFVAGYGVGRFLPRPGEVSLPPDPRFDRLEGLFEKHHKMLGTDFFGALQRDDSKQALAYSKALQTVLLSEKDGQKLFPMLSHLELRGQGGVQKLKHLLESRRMVLDLAGTELRLPATALSDGYQSMLAWLADLLGHAFLEHGSKAQPKDLRGIVLLDEIDLHLHPHWQRRIVPLLRHVFPHVQFIVTTHSPLVVAGVEAHEIIRLRLEGEHVVADQEEPEPGLRTASQLLSTFFDVPFAARQELVEKRRELRELKAANRLSPRERKRLQALEEELDRYRRMPEDTEELDS